MVKNNQKVLIYGYGNPGRQDDALGIELAEKIEHWAAENGYCFVETEISYQLNIEDAVVISDKDLVIFADASGEDIDDFLLTGVNADSKVEFTMHQVTPAFVKYLCNEIYGYVPETYQLHIKGYKWEFMKGLTKKAGENLNKAAQFLENYLVKRINGKCDEMILANQFTHKT